MRRKNRRFIFTGLLMIVLAVGFFAYMLTIAPRSNDPEGMMRIVGQVSGAVGGLGVFLALLGVIGKRV